ncbi:MAG: DUF2851 family protein [Chlorobi bacterium]|nr:DUF2851 family protein [Chlorobiota bacterium]
MKQRLNINESFICKIWEGGDNYYSNLKTDSGEEVEIISYGSRNYDSGPDYKDAKVKIDGKIFTGDIEIHRDFKSWAEHSHPKERRYNSVILQVVLWDSENKTSPKLRIKRNLSTVVLSKHLNSSIHEIWQDIISKPSDKFKLPCYSLNKDVDDDVVNDWLNKLSVERLKLKTERIKDRIEELGKEKDIYVRNSEYLEKKTIWEQVLYEFVFEALGFSKNKKQMLKLSKSLKLEFISKLIKNFGDIDLIQSALFGSAGLLFDLRLKDAYISKLKEIWREIDYKITSPRLNKSEWNFFRLRPQNFPTLRIAYGSQLVIKIINEDLFKNIINCFQIEDFILKKSCKVLVNSLKPAEDSYWFKHYDFGKESKIGFKLLGKQRINDIIVNVIIPIVYFYSIIFKDALIKENVLELYNKLEVKPDNSIINLLSKQVIKNRGIKINTPAIEQALIQLYNFYCVRERCSECEIGKRVFKDSGYEYKIIFY